MKKHHLFISGTGRAGTTFLMQLLTRLGLDTGYASHKDDVHPQCNAGMEWGTEDIFKLSAPYVVKTPTLSEHINRILGTPGIAIDFMLIPIRDLFACAESRREISRQAKKRGAPGGLWLTKNPRKQEAALAAEFHHLVHALVAHEVPVIWLHFPRLVTDPEYLYGKLKPVLPQSDFAAFVAAFHSVSRPELVHDFKPRSPARKSLLRRLSTWARA